MSVVDEEARKYIRICAAVWKDRGVKLRENGRWEGFPEGAAKLLDAAVAEEREACAEVLDEFCSQRSDPNSPSQCYERGILNMAAKTIRARGS
jgi:hypothetical protein